MYVEDEKILSRRRKNTLQCYVHCPIKCVFFQQNFACGSSKKVTKKCDHLLYVTYFQDMLEGVWGGFPKNNSGQYKQGRH